MNDLPLLTPEEELELFTSLRKLEVKMDKAKDNETREKIAAEITSIRNRIIKGNLRLVISIAQKIHRGKNLDDIVEFIDEGNLGLMEAIDRFDPEKGFKFSTYAYWWIRQRIKAAIITSRTMLSASIHLYNLAYHIRNYLMIHGKDTLNYQEVADFLNVPVDKVKKAVPLLGKIAYLEDPVYSGAESYKTVGDTIASSYSSIEEQEMQWLRDFIHDFLENNIFPALETRESYIVKNRYGLNEKHEELTLQQLADSLNLSTERIRQLEKQALTKIREMNIAYVLKDLLQYS
jgi:RNA polymerase primary sigma factor